MNAKKARYTIRSAALQDNELFILWEDGHESLYHPVWLRHQCACSECGTPLNAVRGLRIHHIPDNLAPQITSSDPDGVQLSWSPGEHRSSFEARWLRDHCYSKSERARRKHQPILWDGSIAGNEPVGDYRDACSSDAARLEMLRAVCDYGFCKVVNVPPDEAHSKQLIELVGPQDALERAANHDRDGTLLHKAFKHVTEHGASLMSEWKKAYSVQHCLTFIGRHGSNAVALKSPCAGCW